MRRPRRSSRYRPTDETLKQEIRVVLVMLGNAHRQLDKLGVPKGLTEELTAGSYLVAEITPDDVDEEKGPQ